MSSDVAESAPPNAAARTLGASNSVNAPRFPRIARVKRQENKKRESRISRQTMKK